MNFERYKYHIRGGGVKREQALSEVIGFLMIVALLTIVFSMYLLYVVPIQGRDAEISHMKYITQEFIGLKADIDGLIINNKINLPIARSFELGTLSSVGSGALSILPMSSYIEATGTLMVNEQNDFLMVTINGSMVDLANLPPVVLPPISDPILEINCYSADKCPWPPINFTISDRFYNITTKKRDWYSLNDNNGITNFSIPHIYFNISSDPIGTLPNHSVVLFYTNQTTYDLILETFKNTTTNPRPLISEKNLIENITFPGDYTYNILKDNDLIPNNSTDYFYINPDEAISPNLYKPNNITTKVGKFPPRVGSFQYNSKNRYWVNQNLIYEMGGLFLNQPTGGSSVMLIPSIALTPLKNVTSNPTEYELKVSLNNIRITDTEDISGSVSAQIFSKVDQINQNLINGSLNIGSEYGVDQTDVSIWKIRDDEKPNAKAIWIQFIPDDPRVINATSRESRELYDDEIKRMRETTILWKRGFDQIRTITNKTLSDNSELSPIIGQYSTWIYNFRTDYVNPSPEPFSPPFSANMIIGEFAANTLQGVCPSNTSSSYGSCIQTVHNFLIDPCQGATDCEDFILDYSESEVSLVMQSGAL